MWVNMMLEYSLTLAIIMQKLECKIFDPHINLSQLLTKCPFIFYAENNLDKYLSGVIGSVSLFEQL